jgi:hypothetical protein
MMRIVLAAIVFAAAGGGAGVALAHSNGHESRTAAECEKLPGTANKGERAGCLRCVARKVKHHWHPDYAAGKRCRPDDGKP